MINSFIRHTDKFEFLQRVRPVDVYRLCCYDLEALVVNWHMTNVGQDMSNTDLPSSCSSEIPHNVLYSHLEPQILTVFIDNT